MRKVEVRIIITRKILVYGIDAVCEELPVSCYDLMRWVSGQGSDSALTKRLKRFFKK